MSALTITIIQTDLAWEDKAANLSMLEKKILGIQGRAEVVVLPEMFSTGFSMNPYELAETMDGETIKWMKRIAADKNIILTGSLIIANDNQGESSDGSPDGHQYFNRLIWMLPNGQYGIYDKRHRFAFAGEDEHYTAGTKRLIASVKGWRVNLQVCYDLRFPVWSRQAPSNESENVEGPEYDLLVYVANWPERRNHAWKTLLQARAIENQAFVVGVNRVGNDGNQIHHAGDSMVVDPLGEVLYHKHEEEDIFTITLDKSHLDSVRARFPFWKDADRFWIDKG